MATAPAPQAARSFGRAVRLRAWRTDIPADPTQWASRHQGAAGIDVEDLRVEFEVRQDLRDEPNPTTIKITNLAPDSRAFLDRRPIAVQLSAGYADEGPHLLASGDLIWSAHTLHSPEWVSELQIGDAQRAITESRVNDWSPAGATVRDVVTMCAHALGVGADGSLDKLAANTPISAAAAIGLAITALGTPNGVSTLGDVLALKLGAAHTAHGKASTELTRVLRPLGLTWSVQHGQLQVLAPNRPAGGPPIQVSESKSMVGSPEFTAPTRSGKPSRVRVRMLLRPEITAGCSVQLTSRTANGLHRCELVEHRGDTHGPEWTTHVELLPMQH